jgi:hypothetical protein
MNRGVARRATEEKNNENSVKLCVLRGGSWSSAQGEPKRYAFWFSEFGALPQTPPKDAQEFCEAKLRKTKTALRFWFAQGIEAVSFFAAGEKDTSG